MNSTQNQDTTTAGATASVDVTPADLLRGAALYLQRHGWTQGAHFNFDTPVPTLTPPACALGAIYIATFGTTTTEPVDLGNHDDPDAIARDRAEKCLAGRLDLGPARTWMTIQDWIACWNDQTSRTSEEVIDALRAAADEWDRIHGGAR